MISGTTPQQATNMTNPSPREPENKPVAVQTGRNSLRVEAAAQNNGSAVRTTTPTPTQGIRRRSTHHKSSRKKSTDRTTRLLIVILVLFLLTEFPQVNPSSRFF